MNYLPMPSSDLSQTEKSRKLIEWMGWKGYVNLYQPHNMSKAWEVLNKLIESNPKDDIVFNSFNIGLVWYSIFGMKPERAQEFWLDIAISFLDKELKE